MQREIVLEPLDVDSLEIHNLAYKLKSSAREYDLEVTEAVAKELVEYLLYILQVNNYINLTRIDDVDQALVLHLLDSLLFCSVWPNGTESFLDMGTGAGFPGVPVHLLTGCDCTLIDSVGKKLGVVQTVLEKMNISEGVRIEHDRLETFGIKEKDSYDVVLARALAPLPTLIEYAAPLLAMHGYLIVSKGVPTMEELRKGDRAASLCGLKIIQTKDLELPNHLGTRKLLLYQKIAKPSISLPRAVGLAKKSPLA